MERLANDPDYQQRVQRLDAEREEHREKMRLAERPIVEDLRRVGINADSVWDLISGSDGYSVALPILLEHLERGGYPDWVAESLGDALGRDKESLAFWDRLKDCWLRAGTPGQEGGAAIALSSLASKRQVKDLMQLLTVEERGGSRVYFVGLVLKFGREEGEALVESFRDHPVLGKEATALLKRREGRRRRRG